MNDILKILALVITLFAIGVFLAMYCDHDTTVKAIAAGLQECMQSNNSIAWQKECK